MINLFILLLFAMEGKGIGWLLRPILIVLISSISFSACEVEKNVSVSCKNGNDCEYFITGSTCLDDQCVCQDDFVVSGDGTTCLESAAGYGEVCSENIQCSSVLNPGGVCVDSKCICLEGYHYLQGKCWKSVALDGACTMDQQCYAAYDFIGLTCLDGICQCRKEYYRRGDACRRLRGDAEDCIINDDCACKICDSSRHCNCTLTADDAVKPIEKPSALLITEMHSSPCKAGFFEKDDICIPEIGTQCQTITDICNKANAYSTCIDNRQCGCSTSLRTISANNRVCDKASLLFASTPCTGNGQCATFGAYSECRIVDSKKTCNCIEGAHYDPDGQLCHMSRLIGESCNEAADCVAISSGNVSCTNNICTCFSGTHPSSNNQECREDGLVVGDDCIEDVDCLFNNGRCNAIEKICQCSDNYYAQDGTCIKGVGSDCISSEDCANITSTTCSENKTCQCGLNQVTSTDFRTCLPVVNAAAECRQTDQCNPSMGDLRECKAGICDCKDDAQYFQGQCYLKKQIGDKCRYRAECIYPDDNPDAYICQNGLCTCQYGHQKNGNRCT